MERDEERAERVQRELIDADIDAFICTLPMNVLLLSAYWPVIGSCDRRFHTRWKHLAACPQRRI